MAATAVPKFEAVVVNGAFSSPPRLSAATRRASITVDEALQFTPLTTSVLSAQDRIPFPQIRRTQPCSHLVSNTDRKTVLRNVDQHPINEVKERLNFLLNPDTLTEIKFKQPVSMAHDPATAEPHFTPRKRRRLNSTARMVLETTAVDYRYPTPVSPASEDSPSSNVRPKTGFLTPGAATPEKATASGHRSDVFPTPGTTYVTPPKPNFVVEIPSLSQAFSDASAKAPQTPSRSGVQVLSHVEVAVHVRPQKEVMRSAVQHFQNVLLALFEAHDSLNSMPDDHVQTSHYFEKFPDEEPPQRITKYILEDLYTSAKHLVSNKALNQISFDHLRQLQRICEPAVEHAQFANLRVESEPSEDEVQEWRSRLQNAANGVMSASLVLWTVLADPHEPGLLPEEVLAWISHVLVSIFENCLIPIVESRPDGKDADLFKAGKDGREQLRVLLESAQKLLDVVSSVCVAVRDGEAIVNTVEYLSVKLIFVENAPSEKASLLGIQIYEKTRKAAMGAVAKIYARFPGERPAILREILHSLSKLPSTSRSARQYKTLEGKNIQLITALMMQLVQTTMMPSSRRAIQTKLDQQKEADRQSDSDGEERSELPSRKRQEDSETEPNLTRLGTLSKELFDDGARSAQEIVNELVGKASVTSKSSEDNYRNLFDLFVEDLLNVVSLPDWPAAELLLRLIAQRLIAIATSARTGASAKNMALENLGEMGSAISKVQTLVGSLMTSIEQDDNSALAVSLLEQARSQFQGGLRVQDLVQLNGPFQLVYQFMQQTNSDNLRHKSARGFILTHWAMLLSRSLEMNPESDQNQNGITLDLDPDHKLLVNRVLECLTDESLLGSSSQVQTSPNQCRLAYTLILANSGFCRRLGDIVKTLSTSFGSDQAQVRARSIKSVVSILETDSSLLDRDASIIEDVFTAASDDSAMVRDSALSLIAKFIVTRPALQEQGIKCLLDCTSDSKVGVQKRSMGQLKEIYIRDERQQLRAAIAAAFLTRLRDLEETVSEMASKSLTEIWITPFVSRSSSADAVTLRADVATLVEVLLSTLSQNPDQLESLLDHFVASSLKSEIKQADRLVQLFAQIVSNLFEKVVVGSDDLTVTQKQSCLVLLQLFAHHSPRSVSADQLHTLRPYLGNLSKQDDLNAFKPVVAIFKLVLPYLPSTQKPLLQEVQDSLMKSISRLARRAELDEVTSCLWAIDSVLANSERLVRLASSVLKPLTETRTPRTREIQSLTGGERAKVVSVVERQKSYIRIVGSIGKQWKLDQHMTSLKQKLPAFKGESVSTFMATVVQHFTISEYANDLRAVALESLGSVCQGSPEQFKRQQITDSFRAVLHAPSSEESASVDLEKIVLEAFLGMMGSREERKESQVQDGEEPSQPVIEKIGGDAATQEHDAAASQIAQRFFEDIVQAALGMDIEKAMIAAKVVASVNRQGLVHPKQCVGPLIALEICPDKAISDVAYDSHKMMHQQHESTYERQYVYAVREAFTYAKRILGSSAGSTRSPYVPKLHRCFEVVNTSTSKHVKKFLSVLVAATNVDFNKIDTSEDVPEHLLFTRFIGQNLAFFDYTRLDELLHTILQIEILFTKTGADLAHAIEGPLSVNNNLAQPEEFDPDTMVIEQPHLPPLPDQLFPQTAAFTTDLIRLKQLATTAAVLTIMWETRSHLKRQYGIQTDVRVALTQHKQAKTLDKPPAKLYAATGDAYWAAVEHVAATSLTSAEAMRDRCRAFAELMQVDDEVQVATDGDGALRSRDGASGSADGDDDQAAAMRHMSLLGSGGGRGRKRKGTVSVGGSVAGTPSKRKRGRPSLKGGAPRRRSVSSTGVGGRRRRSTSSRDELADDPDGEFGGG